jgi:hypothetical protein
MLRVMRFGAFIMACVAPMVVSCFAQNERSALQEEIGHNTPSTFGGLAFVLRKTVRTGKEPVKGALRLASLDL